MPNNIDLRKEMGRLLREVISESIASLGDWEAKCRVSIQGELLIAAQSGGPEINQAIERFNRYQRQLETTSGDVIGFLENLFDSAVEISELSSTGGRIERKVSGELGWHDLYISQKTAVKMATVNRYWKRLYESKAENVERRDKERKVPDFSSTNVTASEGAQSPPAAKPRKHRPLTKIELIVMKLYEDDKKPTHLQICNALDKANAEELPGKGPCMIPKTWVNGSGFVYSRFAVALDEIPAKVKPYLSKITARLQDRGLLK